VTLLPYGGGDRVCLGKALAELDIRLLAVGLLKQLSFGLEPDQDLTLLVIPSPPRGMACWCVHAAEPTLPGLRSLSPQASCPAIVSPHRHR
jgi:hypothetical protein